MKNVDNYNSYHIHLLFSPLCENMHLVFKLNVLV